MRLKSDRYESVDEVIKHRKYISGVQGAPCTVWLKKKVREAYQQPEDIHIMGYTLEEATKKGQSGKTRIEMFEANNPELKMDWLLADNQITKQDCYGIIAEAGIELPAMYRLGYHNANCIGCVKGQSGYWNKIRKDFPEIFAKRALQEREVGAAMNKRYEGEKRIPVYLDELDPEAGRMEDEPSMECGIVCQITTMDLAN